LHISNSRYVDQITDLLNEMTKQFYEKDETKKAELVQKFQAETGKNEKVREKG
jgi:hypothetical protein